METSKQVADLDKVVRQSCLDTRSVGNEGIGELSIPD